MTTPTPETPTAADALRRAFAIVKDPCSAAETQRAEVLLGIAREIREEQQYRRIGASGRSRRPRSGYARAASSRRPDSFAMTRPMTRARDAYSFGRSTEGGPAEPPTRAPAAADQVYADDPTAYMPALAERTQSLPIVWSVGDKADCKHCHTPIEFVEVTMQQQTYGQEAAEGCIWRHKYTQQVVCATAPLSGEDEEVVHTFAAPSM